MTRTWGLHFLEVVGVDLRVLGPLFGEILESENGGYGANGDASAAVDALIGIDVKLLRGLELGLVFSRVNAIHGANVDARAVFCSDARLGNYVSHSEFLQYSPYEVVLAYE